jgi:calcium-dependent phosphoinositide phospholipase C
VRTDGWPTLGQARGRVLFTSSAPGTPEAAFVKLNDPIADFDTIRQVVAAGFVVRTRADADTVQARSNDTTMRDMALASGAQWVSTDYPVPDPSIGTGYQVTIPMGAPGRCNPISAPRDCTAQDIENPQHLSLRPPTP